MLNDLTFKKLFVSEETKDITKHFLEDVAGIQVNAISLLSHQVYSIKKMANQKKENGILQTKVDLLVDLCNGQIATIELQNKAQDFFPERVLFYMAKGFMLSYDLVKSDTSKYHSLRSIYGVNIVNFRQHPSAITDEVMHYVLKNEKYNRTLKNHLTKSDLWTLVFFELPKIHEGSTPILKEWGSLFLKGTVSSQAPEYLKRAAAFIAFENLEEEERQLYINFNEREAIHQDELSWAENEGIEQGIKKTKIQFTEALLQKSYPIETIQELTGLGVEEIQKIQDGETMDLWKSGLNPTRDTVCVAFENLEEDF